MRERKSTDWEPIQKWYRSIVGTEGHYYHRNVIFPQLLPLMNFAGSPKQSILDLACGQGVLSGQLPTDSDYWGVDGSKTFIQSAQKQFMRVSGRQFMQGDVTKKLPLEKSNFDIATIILAIQNIEDPGAVFINAAKHLKQSGRLFIVLNHPCYRIPRQSSWEVDERQKIQFRRINCYLSPLKIPIQAQPSRGNESAVSLSFHRPISLYFKELKKAGFYIEDLEEWCSDKLSTGKTAKMENRSRKEIPLFMCLTAIKK